MNQLLSHLYTLSEPTAIENIDPHYFYVQISIASEQGGWDAGTKHNNLLTSSHYQQNINRTHYAIDRHLSKNTSRCIIFEW